MSLTNKDFSSEQLAKRPVPWRLWLVVLVLHAFAIAGLNAVLALNRLAAEADASFDVAILPSDAEAPKPKPPKAEPAKPEAPKPPAEPAKAESTPQSAAEPTPALPAATALPSPEATSVPAPAQVPEAAIAAAPALPASQILQGLRVVPPAPALLRYILTKGNDSARASLSWKTTKPVDKAVDGNADAPYEATFEATYFGISVIKQTSVGVVGAAGLMPTRYADKRRGKSELATHFEREKSLVTFSNNRPEAKLAVGSQDRASFLVQLASLYAGQPERFKAGQVVELPVASSDELETWAFEIGASEVMQLPFGQIEATKVLRRPRKAFDIAVEVWLAPKMDYLPVRIRLTDSGGVTDSQLASKD